MIHSFYPCVCDNSLYSIAFVFFRTNLDLKSRIFSLRLILQILQNSGAIFRSSEDFLYVIKTYLCVSLSRNGVSSIAELFEMALFNFVELIDKFKSHLKIQIEVRLDQKSKKKRIRFFLSSGFISRNIFNDSRNDDQFFSTQMVGRSDFGQDFGWFEQFFLFFSPKKKENFWNFQTLRLSLICSLITTVHCVQQIFSNVWSLFYLERHKDVKPLNSVKTTPQFRSQTKFPSFIEQVAHRMTNKTCESKDSNVSFRFYVVWSTGVKIFMSIRISRAIWVCFSFWMREN